MKRRSCLLLLALVFVVSCLGLPAQEAKKSGKKKAASTNAANAEIIDRTQARSMVITRYGIVATEQTLASQAGAEILARGGNAADAIVAANATLGLTAPMMCGIGGDLFVIYYEAKTGKIYGLNASG